MSTKSSCGFIEITEKRKLHIYHEGLDGNYYIEDDEYRIELPEKIAKEFGKILNEFDKQEKSE